jgi:hypothetical protein
MIVRQGLIPRVSFDAELEIRIPNILPCPLLHQGCGDVIVELLTLHEILDHSSKTTPSCPDDFWKRMPDALIIPGTMGLNLWPYGCHDIVLSAALGQKHLNACPGGLPS